MPNIPAHQNLQYLAWLKKELEKWYDLDITNIHQAARGFYGETWKVETADQAYFLKMDYLPFHQKRFQRSLPVIEYLSQHGIDFAGSVVKTRDGALSGLADGAVFAMFPWVEGKNVENNETKTPEYQLLCELYQLPKPSLELPRETFSNAAAVSFYEHWDALKQTAKTEGDFAVLSLFQKFQEALSRTAEHLEQIGRICQKEETPFFLTHGDAGGNFFVSGDKQYIFDWDEVMYAPVERDAWVMGCFPWARKLFSDTLQKNGIHAELSLERLAYYSYHMFFFYLGEFLQAHPFEDKSERMEDYFENGWIKSRVAFADEVFASLF
jgi:Ser/Thr protein kinase RdoA (MazF antagonist)